ncbi:type IV toxin-antitoxin system AbiEi family antitoxin domain-containing protein [Williamsia phyllosphaerae]|uniref:DUF559 domain-containing protein n=1 Tax=Williamsia phyllosphaerae TaxID=885042 RepID=A0ABQ1UQZ3_9NOCA|nr:type IV toxin-antitoxin system AbiEi family antitoxin domain-containing protein [Williamsia phyllosphaerae]GGF24006.1 hypothetical protein GCM10007298_19900 [Williamsia phyllosphaerae]
MILRELLASHDGVITLGQAESVGLNRSAVQRRVAAGEWRRVGRGVYFVADREVSTRARLRAACWSVGSHAALSGTSAAWWHRLVDEPPTVVTVTARRGRHGGAVTAVTVVHRDLDVVDVVERSDLLMTGVPLTVLDTAAVTGMGVLDSALLRGRVSLEQLLAAHARYPGRRGSKVTGDMLRRAHSGARSEAERLLVGLLRRAAIGGWVANREVCGFPVDIVFDTDRVLVEIDGMAFHSDALAFQHDRTRQNILVANGWTILRFTWADLTQRPQYVVSQIRSALARNR